MFLHFVLTLYLCKENCNLHNSIELHISGHSGKDSRIDRARSRDQRHNCFNVKANDSLPGDETTHGTGNTKHTLLGIHREVQKMVQIIGPMTAGV